MNSLTDLREVVDVVIGVDTHVATHSAAAIDAGAVVAATVLCAWSHPDRIHSEAAFAILAGVAPIPANGGQVTTHYRLNCYGDRQLNRALHIIVQSRIRYHGPTRDSVARRNSEGKTGREIKRCL